MIGCTWGLGKLKYCILLLIKKTSSNSLANYETCNHYWIIFLIYISCRKRRGGDLGRISQPMLQELRNEWQILLTFMKCYCDWSTYFNFHEQKAWIFNGYYYLFTLHNSWYSIDIQWRGMIVILFKVVLVKFWQ